MVCCGDFGQRIDGFLYAAAGLGGRDHQPQALREDRILSEIHAASAICDLFGLSITGPPATCKPSSTPTSPLKANGLPEPEQRRSLEAPSMAASGPESSVTGLRIVTEARSR